MTVVLDSSLFVAALLKGDERHNEAKRVLDDLVAGRLQAVEPLTVLVEVSGAIARQADEQAAQHAFDLLLNCPSVAWESVGLEQAAEAARLARECKVRGGDAIIAAAAFRNQIPLITYDRELRRKTENRMPVYGTWPP